MTTVEEFAATLLEQRKARLRADYPNTPDIGETETVQVKPGKVYTKVDIGPAHNISGKYMVEHATGTIYGIKAYGKVHKGHQYGTLDTIDAWDWGGYTAIRRCRHNHVEESASGTVVLVSCRNCPATGRRTGLYGTRIEWSDGLVQ